MLPSCEWLEVMAMAMAMTVDQGLWKRNSNAAVLCPGGYEELRFVWYPDPKQLESWVQFFTELTR